MTVRLECIDLFPIKSFDGVSVDAARLMPSGGLENDRRFALFDASGKVVNGKRTPLVHAIRTTFDERITRVTVTDRRDGSSETYSLTEDRRVLETRFSKHFGFPVTLREDQVGFPDDTIASGPTVISRETLATVTGWYSLSVDEARRRFRANLTLAAGTPFWEDRLFGPPGEPMTFRIGEALLFGTNPCARCVVPSRDSATAAAIPGFVKIFSTRREAALPAWAERESFDHFYRLAVNTRLFAPPGGAILRVGDPVELVNAE